MESERRKKIVVMQVLVVTITVLIFIFWLFNFQNVWQANKLESTNSDNPVEWEELKKEIGSSLSDMEKRLGSIEEKSKLVSAADILLEGVMQKAEDISSSTKIFATSSSEVASSTIITPSVIKPTPSNSNCPSYINCMPSIGEARSCQIPSGCEGITQIAY
jgi:hypothetical protein